MKLTQAMMTHSHIVANYPRNMFTHLLFSLATYTYTPHICSILVLYLQEAAPTAMFREIQLRVPSIVVWLELCYACYPLLFFGDDESLTSCHGVQQGDPLGPLGFAVTLHSLIERIKTSIPNLNHLNVWYLADGTLMGSPDNLAAALHIIESLGPPRITPPQLEQIPPLHPRISGRPILSTLLKSPPLAGFFFFFPGLPSRPTRLL